MPETVPIAPADVAAAFPYDGPHTPERVAAAAETVGDVLRYLANATRSRGAVPTGPDLGAVLSHLSVVGPRLAQVLQQLDIAADRIADDPTLYDDSGRVAGVTAVSAAVACEQAAHQTTVVADLISEAHQHAARLGHR